jgi:anaerobic magnesium-protoporphyrin IX monomethyl ester cyclase
VFVKTEVIVVDCQSEGLDWSGLEKRLNELEPDLVASSGLATANAYYGLRVCQLAKAINPDIKTVLGGQHFTALADETIKKYLEVDFIVRGEGEKTFTELVNCIEKDDNLDSILGLSYRKQQTLHNPDRPLICDLNTLPRPAYHLVAEHMKGYYFSLMSEESLPFAIIEGSRGCNHNCRYCSQWFFWKQNYRAKTANRIVDEFERLYNDYGSRFFWFTDDNFGLNKRVEEICDGLVEKGLGDEIQWFCQIRVSDIINEREILCKLRKAGSIWALVGFDNPNKNVLESFRRYGLERDYSKKAVNLLKENEIFTQGTFIVGHRSDNHDSIQDLRDYADFLDPDIASFFALTPFPGTEIFEEAKINGWIEDTNWANYDMVHAVMPTMHLTREEVQEELFECYNQFFGSWPRRFRGILSENSVTKRTYLYLAKQSILANLKELFR